MLRRYQGMSLYLIISVGLLFAGVPRTLAGEHLASPASVNVAAASQADSEPAIEFLSSTGGALTAVASSGTLVYVGEGASLTVLDASDPVAIVRRGRVSLPQPSTGLLIEGQRLYVLMNREIDVFDLSNPMTPLLRGIYPTQYAKSLRVVAARAYVIDLDTLYIVDMHDAAHPAVLGSYTLEYPEKLEVVGNIGYLLDYNNGVIVLDVSEPAHIKRVGILKAQSGTAYNVYLALNRMYLSTDDGVEVYDVSHPTTPVFIARFGSVARAIQIVGDIAYVSGGEHINLFDLSDVTHVVARGSYTGLVNGFAAAPTALYVVESYPAYTLRVVDTSNPDVLMAKGTYPDANTLAHPTQVQVDGQRLYVTQTNATNQNELHVFDVTDPVSPTIQGRYPLVDDVQIVGQRTFVVGQGKLQLLDPTATVSPTLRDVYAPVRVARVVDNVAYIISDRTNGSQLPPGYAQLQIVDLSDLEHPVVRGTLPVPLPQHAIAGIGAIYVAGPYAFIYGGYVVNCRVVCQRSVTYVQVVDVRDSTHPILGGTIDPVPSAYSPHFSFVALSATRYLALPSLDVFDVHDIQTPMLQQLDTPKTCGDYQIVEHLVYLVCGTTSDDGHNYYHQLAVLDLSQPSTPT